MNLYPMKLSPIFKDYIWGGNELSKRYQKESGFLKTAESWELSAVQAGESIIQNGAYAHQPFGRWVLFHLAQIGSKYLGDKFPVLIKFLDVKTAISLQVHPSQDTAKKEEGEEGKAEVWYIIDAKPGAFLYYGFSRKISKEEFLFRLQNGTIAEVLNKVPAKAGQVWFITPGVIHSAGGGILLAEVQQSSDTTFRVFDFDRVDENGESRTLHIARACDVMCFEPVENNLIRSNRSFQTPDFQYSQLFSCQYFQLNKIKNVTNMNLFCGDDSFHAILVISGHGEIVVNDEHYALNAGDCYFIPAGLGRYSLRGEITLLLTMLP